MLKKTILLVPTYISDALFKTLCLIGVYVGGFYILFVLSMNNKFLLNQDQDSWIIPHGQGVQSISQKISDLSSSDYILIYAGMRIMNIHPKAGEYTISKSMRAIRFIYNIDNYAVKYRKITVRNGAWYGDIDSEILHAEFLQNKYTIPRNQVIWAETYFYERHENADDIISSMQNLHMKTAQEMWENRDKSIPLNTLDEAIVLASIVERESGINAEQPIIAGVFLNRLQENWRLQSDPTVIYAITNGQGNLDRLLTKTDLQYNSPYNTYVHYGLPPTPIASVGIGGLQAVLHPAKHGYYYFVAKPDGGHAFSKNLEQHIKNVSLYREYLKKKN